MDEVSNSLSHALRLLRCIEPLMAHLDGSLRGTNSVAIGGTADMSRAS